MTTVRHVAGPRLDGSVPAFGQAARRRRCTEVPAVSALRVSPVVLAHALALAGSDPGRLVLSGGGSVTVINRSRKHHRSSWT